MWKYICYAAGFLLGTVMIFGGAFVLNNIPLLFGSRIEANLPIVKGTDAWTRYTTPSVPLQARLYVLNVTNPKEVVEGKAKPILAQVGPFSFNEKRKKDVVHVSSDNKTLDYRLIRTYFFNESDSPPLNSILTLPNVGVFSAIQAAKLKKDEEDALVDPVEAIRPYIANESLYISETANNWLFKGIKLTWLDGLNSDGVYLLDQPDNNTFAIYKKNDTWDEQGDGTMTISTGADKDFLNIGKVVKWNKKPDLSFWKGKTCNTIRGTDGQFFHPFVQKNERLDIFAPDLCRTLTIEYKKTIAIRSIELYRFGIAADFFKPIDSTNSTQCYCVKKEYAHRQKFCKLKGVVDATTCRKKPIVLSTPHFFNGDPSLLAQVDGLAPNATHHDTFIDIEPMTGAVLRVRRRLQVNVEMRPTELFPASQVLDGDGLIHPFVWVDQAITVPDEIAQRLENKLTKAVRMLRILCYASLITGPLILVATLIYICSDIRSEDKKIRSFKSKNLNSSPEYQKVHVVMKTINPNVDGDLKDQN